jgi:hypothetical protein
MINTSFSTCFSLILALSLPLGTQVALPGLVPVAKAGVTTITRTSGTTHVMVRIKTREAKISKGGQVQGRLDALLCGKLGSSCSLVDDIEITVSGKPLIVPIGVFCDLADLHYADLTVSQQTSVFTLRGGDASTSFIEKIQFDQKMVKRKTVAPGEFPDQLLEETTYYMPVLGN